MALAYAKQLGFRTWKIHIKAQKIDRLSLKSYKIVIAGLQVLNKLSQSQFFQETFLLADISMEVLFDILFFIFSNANIQFAQKKLT